MSDIFQRNFDSELSGLVSNVNSPAARSDVELQLMLEEARLEGVEVGKAEGRREAEAAFQQTLAQSASQERAAIVEQISALISRETHTRDQIEQDIIEMFLGISERLIPELLDSYGIDLAVTTIRQSIEGTRSGQVLTIRTSPEVTDVLDREKIDWLYEDARGVDINIVSDTSMVRGAVHVEWDGGRLEYNLEAACDAIFAALKDAAETLKEIQSEAK